MSISRFSPCCAAVVSIVLGVVVGPGQAVAQHPLGIDVSSYQKTITWSDVKSAGYSFGWAKATEGTYYIDAYYTGNEVNGKAAGVYMGSYHFCRPDLDSAATEASYFWNEASGYVLNDGMTIMPMLDFETFAGYVGASGYGNWANQWCGDIVSDAAAVGVTVKPFIYISACNASDLSDANVTAWLSDIANYSGNNAQSSSPWITSACTPDQVFGTGDWTVWQYDDTASISGFSGQQPDVDVFNGSSAALLTTMVIGGGTPPLPPTAPAAATVYWDPSALKQSPGSGGSGNWNPTNANWWYSGTSNWLYAANGDKAMFAGTGGTVALNAVMQANSLTFNTGGYDLTASAATNTIGMKLGGIISVPTGSSPVTIDCALTGSSYTLTGGGMLLLNNTTNSVGPSAIVSNTTVVIGQSSSMGSSTTSLAINSGGRLQNNDETSGDTFLSSSINIALGTGGGYLNDNTNAVLTYGGVISGSGNLTKIGGGGLTGGILTLTATNTYTGNTIISQGVLGLSKTGSISNTPGIFINAGATLDVSAISNWTMGSGTVFQASGTGTIGGSTAATIKSMAANGVNLSASPITLVFSPTSTSGDSTHPPLYISSGILTLSSGNVITISNTTGTALGVGGYTLIKQNAGSISGAPNPTPKYTGAGAAAGTQSTLSVSGGYLYLTIANATTTTLNTLTTSAYGRPVTFTATVAPAPTGGTVQFYDNGVALGSATAVTGGTATYATSLLAAGTHPITAIYSGVTNYAGSSTATASTQQVNQVSLSITANAQGKTYGQSIAFGSGNTNFTSSGLQNGESIGSVTLAVTGNGGASSAPVGTYTITPNAAAGGTFSPPNYSMTYYTGTLAVNLPANTIPVTINGITLLSNGVNLSFSGTPGYVYVIAAATNLLPPVTWTNLSTNPADTNGLFNFTDCNATNTSRFYQTIAQ